MMSAYIAKPLGFSDSQKDYGVAKPNPIDLPQISAKDCPGAWVKADIYAAKSHVERYSRRKNKCRLWAKSGHWSAVCLKQDHEARVPGDCRVCAWMLLPSFPDAVRRSANAVRIVSAIGLNENQCAKERTSAGAPSSCTCSLRRASASVERPSQTR